MTHEIIAALALSACAAALAWAQEPINGWSVHDDNLEYMVEMAALGASEYGINHMQLQRKEYGYGVNLDPQSQPGRELRKLGEACDELGVKLHLWVWELSAEVPEELRPEGAIAAVDPAFWDWVRGRYERFLDSFPELDGLILTLRESPVVMHLSNDMIWPGTPAELVAKTITSVWQACEPRGVDLYVRTFSVTPSETRMLVDGIRLSPRGVRVMTKCVSRDWHTCLPSHPAIGDFPDRVQIVEFDLTGEYSGQAIIPYCLPDYIKERWDYARERGVAGAVGRIDRFSSHCIGSLNEVNVWALSRYVRDSRAKPSDVWDEWISRRFGGGGSDVIRQVLGTTHRITDQILYVRRFKFLNDHSCVPSLSYADSHIGSASLGIWIKGLRTVEGELARPNERTVQQAVLEKRDAIELSVDALRRIEAARAELSAQAYEELTAAFTLLADAGQLWEPMTEAYLRMRMIRKGDLPADDPGFTAASSAMQGQIDRLQERYGDALHFGRKDASPGQGLGRASSLLAEMRAVVDNARAK